MASVIQVAAPSEISFVKEIRRIVFTEEQHIPEELDNDGFDDTSIHAIAHINGKVAGCGRLTVHSDTGKISRIAVLSEFRGMKLGREIVLFLEQEAVKKKLQQLVLYPHKYLEKFYSDLGYRVSANGEQVVGEHTLLTMFKQLS